MNRFCFCMHNYLHSVHNIIKTMKRNTVHFLSPLMLFLLLFLEGEKSRERENNGDKKMHGVPFHRLQQANILLEFWRKND